MPTQLKFPQYPMYPNLYPKKTTEAIKQSSKSDLIPYILKSSIETSRGCQSCCMFNINLHMSEYLCGDDLFIEMDLM